MKKLILEFSFDNKLQEPKLKFCHIFKNSIKVKSQSKESKNIILYLNSDKKILARQDLDSKLDSKVFSLDIDLFFIFSNGNSIIQQSEIRPIIVKILSEIFNINNVLPIIIGAHYERVYRDDLDKYGYEVLKEIQ